MSVSAANTFATTTANRFASALLSPSTTNCKRFAVGIDHAEGREERKRRVRPPPGMKGIEPSFALACGRCETGDVYFGIGNLLRLASGEESRDGPFVGWI